MKINYIVLNSAFCAFNIVNLISNVKRDSLYNYYPPHLYNYKEPVNLSNLMCYFKSIIDKTLDKKLINICYNEYSVAKETFKNSILFIRKDLETEYKVLNDLNIQKNCYSKIEHSLYNFFYMRIIELITVFEQKAEPTLIWERDIDAINKTIRFLLILKCNLSDKSRSGIFIDEKVFEVCNFIINLLDDKLYNIKKELNEYLYITNQCIEKHNKSYEKIVQHEFTIKNLDAIKQMMSQKIDFASDSFDLSIKIILNNIYIINTSLSQTDKSIPDIKYLFNIITYYSYLKKRIFIKRYNLKNNIRTENSVVISSDIESEILKCLNLENTLNLEKFLITHLFDKFIFLDNSEMDHFIKKAVIEDFYIILHNFDDKLCESKFSEHHFVTEQIQLLQFLHNTLTRKFNKQLNYDLFLDNFIYFKMQAILESRLTLIYRYLNKKYTVGSFTDITKLCNMKINNLERYLKLRNTSSDQNRLQKQYKLLQLFIKQYKEKLIISENIEVKTDLYEHNESFLNFYIKESNIEIEFYETENDIVINK
ncbi:hypothetical protein NUSPORA_02030 [Nucleospora cyclopteri]